MTNNKITSVATPGSATDAANKSYVDDSIPIGGIIMWSGTIASIPSNWKLCDGSIHNNRTTPDLRGRFVLSSTSPTSANGSIPLAGGLSTRSVSDIGGAERVSLALSQMPRHSHAFSGYNYQPYAYSSAGDVISSPLRSDWRTDTLNTGMRGGTAGQADGSDGASHENMPPFYVLAFIMRIS